MLNTLIIEQFKLLLVQFRFEMEHEKDKKKAAVYGHKIRAIERVIKIIEEHKKKIKSSSDLDDIPGVGDGTKKRIDEILQTGRLKELNKAIIKKNVRADDIIEELQKVIGIGYKTALRLVRDHGVESVNDLKKLHKSNKIELSEQIKLGLKYVDIFKRKIPREEVMLYDKAIHDAINAVDGELIGIICGSYRRLKTTSNDIDLLIVHPDVVKYKDIGKKTNYLHKLVDELEKRKIIIDGLVYNYSNKYMGFSQLSKKHDIRRLDIRYMPMESYYSALLYFTGSGDFNKKMRGVAKDLGYKLSEYGLYKIVNKGDKVSYKRARTRSEKDIFDALGMEYLPPEKRIG